MKTAHFTEKTKFIEMQCIPDSLQSKYKNYEFLIGDRKVICSAESLLHAYNKMRESYKGFTITCLRVI